MNRLSTQGFGVDTRQARRFGVKSTSMVELPEVDPRQRALEHRIEAAKARLVADIGKLSRLLGSSAGVVRKGFVRATVLLGGLLVLGIVTAVMRRRRRLRVRFL